MIHSRMRRSSNQIKSNYNNSLVRKEIYTAHKVRSQSKSLVFSNPIQMFTNCKPKMSTNVFVPKQHAPHIIRS